MTRKLLREKRALGQKRIFDSKLFYGDDAEAQALRWVLDRELEDWSCSRISKLGYTLPGVGKCFTALIWKWSESTNG
jgi:hypothetical protein